MKTLAEFVGVLAAELPKGLSASPPWGDMAIDGRDMHRALGFMPFDIAKQFLKEGITKEQWDADCPATPWTPESVTAQLVEDAEFGKEKAENQRGISSSLMHSVCKMWLWVLDDAELLALDYGYYGQPLFDEVLAKYSVSPEPVNG